MEFNFEDFSFNKKDILNETKHLSESEKIEFLIGYAKELEGFNDKTKDCILAMWNVIEIHHKTLEAVNRMFVQNGVVPPRQLSSIKIQGNIITWETTE